MLTAIKIAPSNIYKTNHKFHILFSDSKSALQSIIHKNLSNLSPQVVIFKLGGYRKTSNTSRVSNRSRVSNTSRVT